ncbi:MAG: glycosyltransferase [Rikenellaceae bacterium]|jgi:glycosyltransferase involved in cell wall biosynthesis|nr:glycosyltransferase [Rikenellaceae bacterium]
MIKKLTLLGPAYPYRGGIATIMETLARVFQSRGARVDVKTFTVQYPSLLFPGKSQYRDGEPPEGINIIRCVNTASPLNWLKVGRLIAREAPDVVLMKYWTPFMAPCFGTIARVARRNGHTKVLVQLDNVVPHERRWYDRLLTRYFVGSMDGFIYMSEQVAGELTEFDTTKPRLYSPHPMFDHFGERLSKTEACKRLGLNPSVDYVMFFGLVRDYKGLDLLLGAWKILKERGEAHGRRLVVAGEFYADVAPYRQLIGELGLVEDVILHDWFIPDSDVKLYFSLADLLVLPYRSATQSGVTQIAYHFEVPMVVTDVGGLPEIVPDGTVGYVADITADSIAEAIERFYTGSNAERLREGFATEKQRFSWAATADRIEQLFQKTK